MSCKWEQHWMISSFHRSVAPKGQLWHSLPIWVTTFVTSCLSGTVTHSSHSGMSHVSHFVCRVSSVCIIQDIPHLIHLPLCACRDDLSCWQQWDMPSFVHPCIVLWCWVSSKNLIVTIDVSLVHLMASFWILFSFYIWVRDSVRRLNLTSPAYLH